jgi:hypothetical protein
MSTLQIRKQSAPILRTLSVLLYGVPKVGKTTEAAKFPGALLLNCEPSGTDLLKGDYEIADVPSLGALEQMTADLGASAYKTVVLDGFTWLINQAARDKVKEMGERNRLRAYALITEQVQRILGDILRSGKIVVATGHSRIVDVEETEGKVEVRPDINPRLSDGVFGLFSIIAYCYPTKDGSRMLTKPEDNDKRRILAGDRSGVLPKTMELSAEKLMAALKATQPQKPADPQPNGKPAAPAQPAKASNDQVRDIEIQAQRIHGEKWFTHIERLAQEASSGEAKIFADLTPKEADALLATLAAQPVAADTELWK